MEEPTIIMRPEFELTRIGPFWAKPAIFVFLKPPILQRIAADTSFNSGFLPSEGAF